MNNGEKTILIGNITVIKIMIFSLLCHYYVFLLAYFHFTNDVYHVYLVKSL